MRTMLICFMALAVTADAYIYRFDFWKELNRSEKQIFFAGWVNGFGMGREGVSETFMACVKGVTWEQGAAMIDKRFKDKPEKWSSPLSVEIFNVFADEEGPCPEFAKLYRTEKPKPSRGRRP